MDEHGSPMIIVSESCRTHLRRGRRPSSLWYHRVRESFTRFSSVETRLTFVAVFVSRSRIAHPCKKKKKKKLDARVLWMLLASDRGNEFPATEIISFDRAVAWTRYNFLAHPPSNILLPSFRFFRLQGEWNACERGQKLEWGGILFFFFQFLSLGNL